MPDSEETLLSFYPQKVFHYCLRCGDPRFGADSDHSFRCQNCGQSYFINAATAVGGLIENKQGHLLLTRRAHDPMQGTLDLPGGFVGLMETAEQALQREIQEELHLEVCHLQYFTTHPNRYLFENIVYFTLDIIYFCRVRSFHTLQPADDVSGVVFLPHAEIHLPDIGLESPREVVRRYLQLRRDFPQTIVE